MNKILFVTSCNLDSKNGHANMVRMHYKILREAYGDEVIFLSPFSNDLDKKAYLNKSLMDKLYSILKKYPIYISVEFVRKIINTVEKEHVSVIYFDSSIFGNVIYKIKKLFKNIIVITYFPDIQKQRLCQLSEKKNIKDWLADYMCIWNEKMAASISDSIIILNTRDKILLKQYYNRTTEYVIPVIVPDINYQSNGEIKKNKELSMLFIGVDYAPNVNGVNWLINKVIPMIPQNITFEIVGYMMENYKKIWGNKKNIKVIGTVNSLAYYYKKADVIVAPISEGGGMKVKTAEAFSYGKRFIGLPESLEGYWEAMPSKFKNEKIFKCNDAIEFANAIKKLWRDSYEIYDYGIAEWEANVYSYSANYNLLKSIFNKYLS